MTREEFIKRLEEVGFKPTSVPALYYIKSPSICGLRITNNRGSFICDNDLYYFTELEQFLIDKGIVEKLFNAHEYLLSKGFHRNVGGYWKGHFKVTIEENILIRTNTVDVLFQHNTKQSIDKAIKLIDFLIELEKE